MNADTGAQSLLLEYIAALQARSVEDIEALLGDHPLVEIPFLRPRRLVGRTEARRAHAAMFATLESLTFELNAPAGDKNAAIVTGRLHVRRCSGEEQCHEVGLVAEAQASKLHRLSLYADSRFVRDWSDETIM